MVDGGELRPGTAIAVLALLAVIGLAGIVFIVQLVGSGQ